MTLKEYLARKGISQREFAKRLGITQPYLSQVLRHTKRFSAELALKVVEITQNDITRDEAMFPEFYGFFTPVSKKR